MKLFFSLWEVWGSVHLSTALLSPSPTHIHIHTQSVLLSFYTYILNGILSWLISLGDSLPVSPAYKAIIYWRLIMEQVRHKGFIYLFFLHKGFKDFFIQLTHQIFQVLCLSYRLRNEVHMVSNSNLTQPQSWFFLMMLYCLSMDGKRDHIVIKFVHN